MWHCVGVGVVYMGKWEWFIGSLVGWLVVSLAFGCMCVCGCHYLSVCLVLRLSLISLMVD